MRNSRLDIRPVAGAPGAEQPDTPQNNEYYLGD